MGCRRTASPAELVRVCVAPDGRLSVAEPGGRGAWLCRGSRPCLEKALRTRALGRALRANVPDDAVAQLGELLFGRAGPGGAAPEVCEDGASGPRRVARPG